MTEERSLGCLSLPIDLTVQDGKIYGVVLDEVKHLLQTENPNVKFTDNGFIIERTQRENVVFEGTFDKFAVLQDEYLIEVHLNNGEHIISAILC